ncbi:unnamed protein product [Arabidopsis lyrata]|nr:unnamed protein product [Arabidopsis lyrata]
MIEFSMSSLLDNLVKTSDDERQELQVQSEEQQSLPVATITHISALSDSTSSIDESETDKSLPNQFAIGDESHIPKEEPIYKEISSDEEMGYEAQGVPKKQFASKIMVFTFDDIPFEKWNSRLDEFHAWMTSEAITSPTEVVIQQFTSRLSGALKEWWNSLGEYRQQQVYQTTIPLLLGEIHREFVGTPNHLKEQLQEEFYTAKCCSLKKRDLAKHFERQTRRVFWWRKIHSVELTKSRRHLSRMTRPLQKMLSKNPPLWTSRQTEAIKSLKAEVQKLPPLKIPSSGMRILQTDASDKYWGAILFEEMDGKRQICGYKSGRFKDSEQHYHSTFKEILAVKKAIERFEFHLIGHKFRIEMDMSSFPKMLQFKQKMVPHQQLLRWSEWFSKYDFESVYLKGTKNTLADMLSRKPVKQETPDEIHMMASSSETKKSYYDFEADVPEDVHQLISRNKLHELLRTKIFSYQSTILTNYGVNCHHIAPMGIHPDYPFAHLYRIENSNMPEEVLCFLWYLCAVYTVGITFDIQWLYHYVNTVQDKRDSFSTFLRWFSPLTVWSGKLRRSANATNLTFKKLKKGGLNPFFNPHSIYFFHRPVKVNRKTSKILALPTLIHHGDFSRGVRPDFNLQDNEAYENFQTHAFHLNNARQTFPIPWTGLTDFFLSYMWPYVDKVVEVSTSKSILPKKTVMQFYSGARNMFAATELQRQVSVKILNFLSNS